MLPVPESISCQGKCKKHCYYYVFKHQPSKNPCILYVLKPWVQESTGRCKPRGLEYPPGISGLAWRPADSFSSDGVHKVQEPGHEDACVNLFKVFGEMCLSRQHRLPRARRRQSKSRRNWVTEELPFINFHNSPTTTASAKPSRILRQEHPELRHPGWKSVTPVGREPCGVQPLGGGRAGIPGLTDHCELLGHFDMSASPPRPAQ